MKVGAGSRAKGASDAACGNGYQDLVQPWVILDRPEAPDAAIGAVRMTPRPKTPLATAMGDALRYGSRLMEHAPVCARKVIDVAGDGRNSEGISVARTDEREDFTDITGNGLAVGGHEADLVHYFEVEVLRGPGAFVEVAPTQADYPPAIRRKLLCELHGPMIGAPDMADPDAG